MIRSCGVEGFERIYEVINNAAEAYKGIIPADCWREPYMSKEELQAEIHEGVLFWGDYEEDDLIGVMGIQSVQDVALIRHAYVRTDQRRRGIGGRLLSRLCQETTRPMLVGTWAAASWAIRFYKKHDFQLVSLDAKDRLLKKYWSVPKRQVETSVVLADQRWFEKARQVRE